MTWQLQPPCTGEQLQLSGVLAVGGATMHGIATDNELGNGRFFAIRN